MPKTKSRPITTDDALRMLKKIGSGGGGGSGKDGISPIVNVSKANGVTTITITDAEGVKTATINDGMSPTISVSKITGGHRMSITDINGTKTFDVMDGKDGGGGSAASSYDEETGELTIYGYNVVYDEETGNLAI